jgi:hypothetical protein
MDPDQQPWRLEYDVTNEDAEEVELTDIGCADYKRQTDDTVDIRRWNAIQFVATQIAGSALTEIVDHLTYQLEDLARDCDELKACGALAVDRDAPVVLGRMRAEVPGASLPDRTELKSRRRKLRRRQSP